jgi:hypothetical protein
MSSTTTPSRPGALDRFYTPDDCAAACVATLGDLRGQRVWEPHAGGGGFVRALLNAGAVVTASDLDPEAAGLNLRCTTFVGDFLAYPADDGNEPAWVVGNPPYNDAEAHVRHAIAHASIGVGMLLRLAFLETEKRRAFWREHPATEVHVLVNRPSFTGGGNDSAAYGWFVWRRWCSRGVPTAMYHLNWRAS